MNKPNNRMLFPVFTFVCIEKNGNSGEIRNDGAVLLEKPVACELPEESKFSDHGTTWKPGVDSVLCSLWFFYAELSYQIRVTACVRKD